MRKWIKFLDNKCQSLDNISLCHKLVKNFRSRLLFWLVPSAALLLACYAASAQDYIPDHARTPGAINHHVTQDNAALTVCVAGWTRTIRPSSSYTAG